MSLLAVAPPPPPPRLARLVTVAAVQMACSPDAGANVQAAEARVRAAAAAGAQIVVLQELFATPYFCIGQADCFGLAVEHGDTRSYVARFSALAKELAVVLPVSYFERAGAVYFNSVVVFDADGRSLGRYRKSHIPDSPGYHEKWHFSPGDSGFKVFRTRYAAMGVGICWDQWFPEAARVMALAGAELLVYPTAIGSEPQDAALDSCGHWRRVMQGHAAANLVPVVASNRVGREQATDGGRAITFYGSSFICDGTGEIVQTAARVGDALLMHTFDLGALASYRANWGVFRDRRPDLYRPLLSLSGETAASAPVTFGDFTDGGDAGGGGGGAGDGGGGSGGGGGWGGDDHEEVEIVDGLPDVGGDDGGVSYDVGGGSGVNEGGGVGVGGGKGVCAGGDSLFEEIHHDAQTLSSSGALSSGALSSGALSSPSPYMSQPLDPASAAAAAAAAVAAGSLTILAPHMHLTSVHFAAPAAPSPRAVVAAPAALSPRAVVAAPAAPSPRAAVAAPAAPAHEATFIGAPSSSRRRRPRGRCWVCNAKTTYECAACSPGPVPMCNRTARDCWLRYHAGQVSKFPSVVCAPPTRKRARADSGGDWGSSGLELGAGAGAEAKAQVQANASVPDEGTAVDGIADAVAGASDDTDVPPCAESGA